MTPPPSPPVTRRHRGTETATVRAILDYLRLRGYLAVRMNSRVVMLPGKGGKDRPYRMGGVKGMADILACVPLTDGVHPAGPIIGRFVAIEVKREGGRVTPEQLEFLQAVVRAQGIAFIARSVKDVQEHGL